MDNGVCGWKQRMDVWLIGGVEGENQKTMMQAECKL